MAPAEEAKRRRLESDGTRVLSIETKSEAVRKEVAEDFQQARPYRHCVLSNVVDDATLRTVRDEIIGNLTATFKETDIYKVLQTGDLANLDGLDKGSLQQLPHLKKLRDVLYSKEFRGFVESVTGCGTLVDKTDCSCNIYPQGGHLLCHDDVIGTRKVSYILYLTDPDRPWESEDGGALALYDCVTDPEDKTRKLPLPDFHPVKRILPEWNTMAMFAVLPGKSFHDIEEVVARNKPRLSISGWWHGEVPPEGAEKATLNQILVASESGGTEAKAEASPAAAFDRIDPFLSLPRPVLAQEWLDDADVSSLARFVHPQYLVRGSIESIAEKFVEESHIQLHTFLKEDVASKVADRIRSQDEKDGMFATGIPPYTAGIGGPWTMRGPTHKQRYLECGDGGKEDILWVLKEQLFDSEAFKKLLSCMAKVEIKSARTSMRRFRPGLDYTLAHSGVETACDQIDATFCMVQDSEVWGLGEVGGYDCYMVNDTEAEGPNNASAEVYNEAGDENDETVTLPATWNCLSLVLCTESVMRFTKYVSATAPGSRWDIMNEYEVNLPDDD